MNDKAESRFKKSTADKFFPPRKKSSAGALP